MNYVKGFDTVRTLAVLLVIVSHWGPHFDPGTTAHVVMRDVVPNGGFGVTLFFVLSGYLITSILLKEKLKHQLEGGSRLPIVKSFFVRRSLRIFPIYYLLILILFVTQHPYLRTHIAWFLTYTSNFLPFIENKPNPLIHTWSLAVEEQFYLIWPWVILFVHERHLKKVFIAAIIIGIVSKYIVMYVYHHDFSMLVINWLDAFAIGGGYAYMRLDEERYRKFDRRFWIVLLLMLFVAWRVAPISGIPSLALYSRTLEIVVSLAIIIGVLNNKSEWMRKNILENTFLNFLGKISYGLYLYHYVLEGPMWRVIHAWWDSNPGLPGWVRNFYFGYVVCYIALFIVSWLSYKVVEVPLLKLKKYFRYS